MEWQRQQMEESFAAMIELAQAELEEKEETFESLESEVEFHADAKSARPAGHAVDSSHVVHASTQRGSEGRDCLSLANEIRPSPRPSDDAVFERVAQQLTAALERTAVRGRSDCPKQQLQLFSGNPADFPRFIHNFECTVEEAKEHNRVRLNLLIQHCKGDAQF